MHACIAPSHQDPSGPSSTLVLRTTNTIQEDRVLDSDTQCRMSCVHACDVSTQSTQQCAVSATSRLRARSLDIPSPPQASCRQEPPRLQGHHAPPPRTPSTRGARSDRSSESSAPPTPHSAFVPLLPCDARLPEHGRPTWPVCKARWDAYSSAKTSFAMAIVCSMSASVCASDMKPASYCDGAR